MGSGNLKCAMAEDVTAHVTEAATTLLPRWAMGNWTRCRAIFYTATMTSSALVIAEIIDGMTSRGRASLIRRMYGLPKNRTFAESWWHCTGMDRPADLIAFFYSAPRAVQVVLSERGWPPDWHVVGIAVPAVP